MPRGTDPTPTAIPTAPGTTWPPAGGAPQVIVRLPDLRAPKDSAPTLILAIDPPHVQPTAPSAAKSEQPAVKLEGPHWGRGPIESARQVEDWKISLAKHPRVVQAIGFAQRRVEFLLVLAAVLIVQIAIQFAWRGAPVGESEPHPAVAVPSHSAPAAVNPISETARSPRIVSEAPPLPRVAEPIHSPIAAAPVSDAPAPVERWFAPTIAPSAPETGTTTEPRDVPPWESWPTQPKAAEPVSNQAASNTPAKVSEAPTGPTLAPPRDSTFSARPKSVARLKGTISRPPVEPTHEHARRSLY